MAWPDTQLTLLGEDTPSELQRLSLLRCIADKLGTPTAGQRRRNLTSRIAIPGGKRLSGPSPSCRHGGGQNAWSIVTP
jgi:hypothetical protein